jgi:iron complex outermembrane receptor protein
MKNMKYILLAGTTCATFVLTAAQAQEAPPAPEKSAAGSSSAPSSGIGDIIVTARKRAESAQNVPVSVTAFSPELLQEKQIVQFEDLAHNTSGVTLSTAATTTQYAVAIRGQNTLDPTIVFDSAVGTYVDGVYIGNDRANAVALNFDDAASVEVLKGPQGTLYGRNTSGGALKLDHVIPDYEIAGWAKAELGNYDYHAVRGALTVPIVDQMVTLRLYGRYQKRDGFGRNTFQDVGVGGDRTYSFGGTLRLDPTPDLNIVVRANYDNNRSGGLSINPVALLPTTNLTTLAIALDNGLPLNADGSLSPATIAQAQNLFLNQDRGFYDTTSRFPTPSRAELYNGSVTATWDASDSLQIKSITGYRHIGSYHQIDFSGLPTSIIAGTFPFKFDQFSEELTFSGEVADDRLKYTVGLFYLHAKGDDENVAATAPIIGTVFGPASPIPVGRSIQAGKQITKSYAAYAQLTYEITPGLSITGGLRYTKEDKDLTTRNRFVLGTYNPANGYVDVGPEVLLDPLTGTGNTICAESQQGVGNACRATQPFTFKKLTWLGSVDYKITPGVLVYGKVSRGFRGGGGQLRLGAGAAEALGVRPFGPEVIDDFEIGLKSDLFDGKVRANIALYYDNYRGLQRSISEVINGQLTGYIRSAGKARVQGAEFELLYKPVPELTLGWAGAYTDAKYQDYRDGAGNDLSQQKFQGIPKFAHTTSASYVQPTSFGDVAFSIDYFHTSDVPLQPGAGPATSGGPSNTNPWATQKAYGLLNGRLAANVGDSWSVGVWGKNLANKHYFTYNLDLTAALGYAVSWGGSARTFGADVTYRF